jgi:hypothetical protein
VPDEVNVNFAMPGEPAANMLAWLADPPAFLVDGGYRFTDDSYESLVYEADVTTGFARVVTFGVGKTLYRLTFTFRSVDGATQVNALGQMVSRTRDAFTEWVTTRSAP